MDMVRFDSRRLASVVLAELLALLVASSLASPLHAQEVGPSAAPGFPTDWSHSRLIFTDGGSVQSQIDAQREPRAQMQWMRENQPLLRQLVPQTSTVGTSLSRGGGDSLSGPLGIPNSPFHLTPLALHPDWNFSLQTNSPLLLTAIPTYPANVYPAKYTFAPEGAANCSTDFVVFGLNVTGTSSQANLIGVNNLYTGTTGFCGTVTNGGGSGTVPTPHVQWAYADTTGPISSSITLNLTGTKVAYVVNSNPAQVHVVTLGASTGTVTSPSAPTFSTVTLAAQSSNSSIFVDYNHDIGWVSGDGGRLYKITTIFTGTPTLAATLTPDTTNCSATGSQGVMTPPVYDSVTDTVFVACKSGFIYGYTSASSGTPVAMTGSIQLAFTSGNNNDVGIISPPIVDSTNHILYLFYGEDLTNKQGQVAQVVYTATPRFSSLATTSLTTAGTNRVSVANANGMVNFMNDGALSRSYFSGFSSATSFLYICGPNSAGGNTGIALQQLKFDPNNPRILLSGSATVVSTLQASGSPTTQAYCSHITRFFNANTSNDYLFLSVPGLATANMFSFNITNNTAGGALSPSATATVSGGSDGIIVDGADPSNQASSLYFNSQTAATNACSISSGNPAGNVANPANTAIGSQSNADCAYKLTQIGLQ